MTPVEILMDEHRVIEQVLDCLEVMASRSVSAGTLDKDSALMALDFFREFADHCHHAKEEDQLFPLLEARGFPHAEGPTSVMRHEHVEGREHVAAMAKELDTDGELDSESVIRFRQHALQFILLLRAHIEKEDQCLFPMADRALSADDQEQLSAQFDQVREGQTCAMKHGKYLKIADELARRFGVERTAPATP